MTSYPAWLPEPLEPVVARLARADECIYQVADLAAGWSSGHSVTVTQYRRRSDSMTRTLVTAIRPIPPSISLLFSEVIHHLRAALDNVVWALVVAESGTPDAKAARSVALPVYTTAEQFQKWSKSTRSQVSYLAKPGERLFERVRSLQPFTDQARIPSISPQLAALTGQTSENVHPLRLLQEYSNTDKHRAIRITVERAMHTTFDAPFMEQDRTFRELRVGTQLGKAVPWGTHQIIETASAVMLERPHPWQAAVSPATEAARLREWVADSAIPHLIIGSTDVEPLLPAHIDLSDNGLTLRERIAGGTGEDAPARITPVQHARLGQAMKNMEESPTLPEVVDEEWSD